MLAQAPAADERVATYATATDYCNIFAEEMHSLYLLAFLLTADQDKAEQCFVDGLGECVDRSGVFMHWARSCARRTIVKHAIRMIKPVPEESADRLLVSARSPAASGTSNPFAGILSLYDFERFVFVVSVLEGESDEDCQSLLRCSRLEVVIARWVAIKLLAAASPGYEHTHEAMHFLPELLN
jgi:hypothetical protein